MRSTMAALVATALLAGPALADPWKDESGHGRGWDGERKEEFWDGNCKVERKWGRSGEYKEKRKCKERPLGYAVPVPDLAHERMPNALGPVPGLPGIACDRDLIGGLLGAAAGGVIGNRFGRGDGDAVATIGGVVIGALVGGVIGRGMDEADHACVGQALEYGRTGQAVAWRDPDGDLYEVTPTRGFERGETQCREYRTVGVVDGERQTLHGIACRQPDGSWQAVK